MFGEIARNSASIFVLFRPRVPLCLNTSRPVLGFRLAVHPLPVPSARSLDGTVIKNDVAVAPVVIEDTTAESINAGIEERTGSLELPTPVGETVRRPTKVLGSDSAKSLIRLATHYATEACRFHGKAMFIHGRCMMHMLWAALAAMLAVAGMTTAMFCATVLIRKGHNMKLLKQFKYEYLDEKLEVVFDWDPSFNASSAINRAWVELLDSADDMIAVDDNVLQEEARQQRKTKRKEARQKLLVACPGDWSKHGKKEDRVIHFCHVLCPFKCKSRADSVKGVSNLLDEALLDCPPGIPALNRWNKVWGPLVWFGFALNFYGFIMYAFFRAHAYLKESLETIISHLSENVGMATEDYWKALKSVRWKKTMQWLEQTSTAMILTTTGILFQVSAALLGSFFINARLSNKSNSIVPFLLPDSTSLPGRAIRSLIDVIRDTANRLWHPLTRGGAMTQKMLRAAMILGYMLLGQIYMRLVLPFLRWPFILLKAAQPTTRLDQRKIIFDLCWDITDCCIPVTDGLTIPFRDSIPSRERMDDPENIEYLLDVADATPASNVIDEDRFARARRHLQPCEGPGTLCCDHMISEWQAMYETALAKLIKGEHKQRLNKC
jgi:hypothetical protein